MKKIDRRVLKTRQSLSAALIRLSLEMGYTAVTIRAITHCADVGYATFFRHFKSKDDLFLFVLRGELQGIYTLMSPQMTPYEEALAMFRHIRQNHMVYRMMMSISRREKGLVTDVYTIINKVIYQRYIARDESAIPLEVAVNHMVTSIMELVHWWIRNEMQRTPEEMATILSELVIKATEMVAVKRRSKLTAAELAALAEAPQPLEAGSSNNHSLNHNRYD